MISFFAALFVLIAGYFLYGRLAEKIFSPDSRSTPALTENDGVDFVPMKTWKCFLIQLLNIAGTGPIFGALMGAEFGPIVFLWIAIGNVLGGAVADYMMGMVSVRNKGCTVAKIIGAYTSNVGSWIMRVILFILLILCGTVFVTSPATLLSMLTPDFLNENFWIVIILLYYFIATIFPIDKIVGKIYPIFGIVLIAMAVGIVAVICASDNYSIPELTLNNLHPEGLPVWPYMFVTVACGAISGFHATQSPIVAKCINSEKSGRKVFYGAMVFEGIVALVWAAAGVAFYGTTKELLVAMDSLSPSGVVYEISTGLMGKIGGLLAVIGVVICPISSGDTSFRGARLLLGEILRKDFSKLKQRLGISVVVLSFGAVLTQIDFNFLWRYFSWTNQTLAAVVLWGLTAYLLEKAKKNIYSIVTALPAAFMTAVTSTYILMAREGLKLSYCIAYPVGIAIMLISIIVYIYFYRRKNTIHSDLN